MRTRVKICGISRTEDAELVIESGVDAIGLVFYEKSPRFVKLKQAAAISQITPAFVSRVALFKDADSTSIDSVLASVEIDLIQFHGSETPGFCQQFALPYIKAVGIKGAEHDANFLLSIAEKYQSARALLLDGHAAGEAGGSGESFDWASVAKISCPLILAGGLTPENVQQAISLVRPYAVDVSSGVESAPGIKDQNKVAAFMQQINADK